MREMSLAVSAIFVIGGIATIIGLIIVTSSHGAKCKKFFSERPLAVQMCSEELSEGKKLSDIVISIEEKAREYPQYFERSK